ncbi:MAG TPA: alpha/beta hydrolase [Sphingomonadaceae bacterium]|nr:alpha/beta hydrolase [Sphingomonadaceae bacterium]
MPGTGAWTRRAVLGTMVTLAAAPGWARDTPYREGYLDVPGGRLWHWDTGGDGAPLILIHPGTGGHQSWIHQRGVFARAGFRTIAYSRWGYAPSDPPPASARPEPEDLLAVLDAMGIDRTHLVGVAAGAGIVAPFVGSYPQRVRRAALIGSVLGIEDEEIEAMTARLDWSALAAIPAEFRELGPSYRATSPEGVARWRAIARGRPAPPLPRSRSKITPAALIASQRPLLLATGDADQFAPPPVMRAAAARLPHARYHTIEDSGHAPFWEQPERFNRLLLDFLRE